LHSQRGFPTSQRIEKIVVADGSREHRLHEIFEIARANGIRVDRVSRETVDRLVAPDANHQGVVAFAAAADYVEPEDIISVASEIAHANGLDRIVRCIQGRIEDVELPDIPQAHPTAEDEARNAREQKRVDAIWRRKPGAARFSLPLGDPAEKLPEGKTFGWNRSFNGKPAEQPHMGADYAIAEGTPILASADGTVALAEELFYPGKGVIVDHGDGLFTVYYHLSEIQVHKGQTVKKGERLGLSGHTGRATGPHLFFAVRWRNARIDPQWVLLDVEKLPAPVLPEEPGSGSPSGATH